jgi:predicted nuclease with TOPRIM domain
LFIVREKISEMLKELDSHFVELERKILILQKKYLKLKEAFSFLDKEHEELQMKYDQEREKNQMMAEEQKNLKLHAAISGNPDHNRLMKNHINRLIKEVDTCIAQLQNSGL